VNLLDIIYCLVVVGTAPWWARKKRTGWRERFGHVGQVPPRSRRPRVMIHAVSVGEVNALRPLIPLLLDRFDLVVSASTDTGIARARALFAEHCTIVRYPLDLSRSVARFLDAVQPDLVALVELEVWPNFVTACARRSIPVAVINGRLSERSFRGYRKIRFALRRTFASLSLVGAQDEIYRKRFIAMGVVPDRCKVTGSMKWDAVDLSRASQAPGEPALRLAEEMGIDPTRPLIVAGSTAPGEEALIHRACPPGVQLLCAPRHPPRFDQAAADLPGCVRRSARRPGPPGTDRFLLDTIGELSAAYELADLVVIGRSFTPQRGSDPTEPVALGKPVVVGPSMENFESITQVLERAGAIVRTLPDDLAEVLSSLLSDPHRRHDLATRGVECVRTQQGASAQHAELIAALLARAPENTPIRSDAAGAR